VVQCDNRQLQHRHDCAHVTSVCGERKGVRRAWQFTRSPRVGMHVPRAQSLAMTPQLKQTQDHQDSRILVRSSTFLPTLSGSEEGPSYRANVSFPSFTCFYFTSTGSATVPLPIEHHTLQCVNLSSTLKMEARSTSETIVPIYQTTRRHIKNTIIV
jgi:hypothetical protein